ncbi:MAG: nucleoside-diphosphate kinase [bacterium]|nr:nucleoside-diphosphate kinase [bacterium]
MLEQSLILIKPDAMKKNLIGHILIKLLDNAAIKIVGIKLTKVSLELAKEHYNHMHNEPCFDKLIHYITGKEHDIDYLIALVCEGDNAIKAIRQITGETHPEEALPTTIRGAFGRINKNGIYENVIHSSSNLEDAKREIALWFKPEELMNVLY